VSADGVAGAPVEGVMLPAGGARANGMGEFHTDVLFLWDSHAGSRASLIGLLHRWTPGGAVPHASHL
jgi:hypothetical protein